MNSRKIAFASIFTGIFLFGVSMVLIGSILPLLRVKFGISEVQAGSLFSILPLGLMLGSVAFGPVADRYGYRWVLVSAALFLALGFAGIAHAGTLGLLRAFILVFGVGGGIMNGATSALVSDLSEGKQKIINLTWLGAFFAIGAFTMPFLLSIVNEAHYFKLIDFVAILSVLVALTFVFIAYPGTESKGELSFKLIPLFLNNRVFMLISFFLFFQSAFEAIVNNWSVSFLINAGFTPELALKALSASVLGMITMRLLVGSVLKEMDWQKLVSIALVLLFIGFLSLQFKTIFAVKLIGLFLIGAGLAPGFPVFLGVAGEIFKEVSATSFSFIMVIALSGNVIINYFTGFFAEKYSISIFPYVVLIEVVAMSLLFIAIRRNKNRKLK